MMVLTMLISCGVFRDSCYPGDSRVLLKKAMVPAGIRSDKFIFCARAVGTSMTPRIQPGQWCTFNWYDAGTRNDSIVLVEDRTKAGLDRYTLKKYRSQWVEHPDGSREQEWIRLYPLNDSDHTVIELHPGDEYAVLGVFLGVVDELEPPCEKYEYEPVEDE